MQNVLPLPWRREHPRLVPGDPVVDAAANRTALVETAVEVPATAAPPCTMTVRGVHLGSLASLAVRCALVVALSVALAIAGIWYLASAAGVIGKFESFMRTVGFRDFHVSSARVIAGSALVTVGVALAIATVIVVAGAVYNLLAAHGGGLRLRLAEPIVPDAAGARHDGAMDANHAETALVATPAAQHADDAVSAATVADDPHPDAA